MDKAKRADDDPSLKGMEKIEDEMPDTEDIMDGVAILVDSIMKGTGDTDVFSSRSENLSSKDLGENYLHRFCKEAAHAFFNDFGLISHQINSYNDFVDNGLQKIFELLGEVNVDPEYDPSKKGSSGWRHARITFGKVRLEPPTFWTEKHNSSDEPLKLLPKHARLQNMTYSARMFVEVNVKVTR